MFDKIVARINEEGLAFSMGSSPHATGTTPHSTYAFVAKSYFDIHNGKANAVGRAYARPGDEALCLQKAYVEFRELNPKS